MDHSEIEWIEDVQNDKIPVKSSDKKGPPDKVNQVDQVAELTKAVGYVNVDSGWGNTFMQSVLLQKPEFVNIFQFYRIRISIFGPI